MSVPGQTETRAHQRDMSVLPPGADMSVTGGFAPEAAPGRLKAPTSALLPKADSTWKS
jgi:hypothetical protein